MFLDSLHPSSQRLPWMLRYVFLLSFFLINLSCVCGHFTSEWAVEIEGGDEIANEIADRNGFHNDGKIFENVYHFIHRRLAKRSIKPSNHYHKKLTTEPAVRWAEQQKVKRRVKRDFNQYYSSVPKQKNPRRRKKFSSRKNPSEKFTQIPPVLSDPKWDLMWYLNRGGSFDMNVQRAWLSGATGKNVVVTILDDGLEKDHPDLIQNYDPNASYDVNGRDFDPMPRYDLINSNRHGTRCAGEVAAKANNTVCAVGVAYEASVGGVRMLDGDVTDAVEARSLSLNPQHIDIYSASWGPDDDGKTVDGPGQLATRAFIEGVTRGRNGKGSIFVWASGNGGRDEDNCNCDGYTNSIWTLSISSATEKGSVPWYSEACSSTLATTYSSGALGERQIITTDLHHGCTDDHTGTSASAPLAAGICALALHANMNLTWRDMQHVVVRTARPENLKATDWQINGVGRKVSHRFGYGLMDAHGMVELARNWTTVPPQRKCEVPSGHVDKVIPSKNSVTLTLEVSDCPGVNYLEHVQSKVTLSADRRGDMEIYLISPSGTKSNLLALRHKDYSRAGFHSWPFMTVHMWGESPLGIWKLEIHNNGIFYSQNIAKIQNWTLLFYGTEFEPGHSTHSEGPEIPRKNVGPPINGNSINAQSNPNGKHSSHEDGSVAGTKERGDHGEERNRLNNVGGSEEARRSGSNSPFSPDSVKGSGNSLLNLSSFGCFKFNSVGGCLACKTPLLLHKERCVENCPEKTFLIDSSSTTGSGPICIPCHYSCKTCSGPFDYQCVVCWPDAVLQSSSKEENFCRPMSLLRAYEHQSSFLKLTIPLFVGLFCIILGLAIYTFRNGSRRQDNKPLKQDHGIPVVKLRPGQNTRTYSPVEIDDRDKLMTKVPFHDQTSDEEW